MLQLPPELIVATLCHATLIDIVRCKQICKTFNTIINESTALQYLIELGCAGYVDGNYDKGTLPQHERLRRLIEIESAWRGFSLATKTKLELPEAFSSIYEFCGGVFIRRQHSAAQLNTTRFSSIFGGVTSDSETRNLADLQPAIKAIRDITIDPGSDLLIAIECREGGTDEVFEIYDFHIRSLSTCLPHPAAQQSVVTHLVRGVARISTAVIVEDFFSAIFSCASQDGEGGDLVVWNWKTGAKIARLKGPFPPTTTCTFLSATVFVIPQTEYVNGEISTPRACLTVYGIPSSEEGGVVTPRLLAVYNMPVFTPGVMECVMVIRFNLVPRLPPRGAHSDDGYRENPKHQSPSKPFYTDPLKRIFVIGMEVTHRLGKFMDETEVFTVFLHSDAFLRLLGEETVRTGLPSTSTWKDFQWDEYCNYARVIEAEPRATFIRFVHGQRYLDYEENPNRNCLHIWDFNPYPIKRRRPVARAPPGGDREEPEIFNKGVMSRNALLDGEETVQYTVPANDDENVRPSVGKQPTGSTESKWALAPVYDSGPTFIENVVFQNKVRSALPYRRITSRTTFANVNGAMLDDERIILFKKDYQAEHLELTVMGIVPETSDHAVLNQSLQNS